ncbi:MAG: hypothetical protein K2K27_02770 [Muribaculaceae bacterium]|nr:hypothetical protein [Muribaculaceae bacterium]MDE6643002.1 hypothetical protein [Muribaculaceae bacterium]
MKRLIYFLSFIFTLLLSPIICFASNNNNDDEDIETMVTDEIITTWEDPDTVGHRSVPLPIYVTISKTNGVSIIGISTADIISYQICNTDNNVIGTYFNDKEFAKDLFLFNEFVKIKIILTNRTLVGEI